MGDKLNYQREHCKYSSDDGWTHFKSHRQIYENPNYRDKLLEKTLGLMVDKSLDRWPAPLGFYKMWLLVQWIHLLEIFQKLLNYCMVPKDCKAAYVTPLFEEEDGRQGTTGWLG